MVSQVLVMHPQNLRFAPTAVGFSDQFVSLYTGLLGKWTYPFVAVAAFNIVSTLVMVVTDKQSDIAILKTLGATSRMIMGIFIFQGMIIGLIGTLLGMTGGVLIAENLEQIVSYIEQLFNVQFIDPNIYYINQLPSDLHWSDVWLIGGSAFLISLLATLYPAWLASRTQPAEALRYE